MSRTKAYILVGTVMMLIVVLSVFVFLFRKPAAVLPAKQNVTESIKPVTGPVTVTYDNTGFAPKEIVVTKGTTVSFDNKTETPIWVASDPHPEHLDYPEFDVVRVNGQYPEPGNDYSFTFDKTGVWTYHDHTLPGDIGMVTVQ